MPRVSRGRWARGMLSVAGVEHRSPVLASAARVVQLRTAGGKAWRRDVDLSPLPAAVRPNRHGRYRRMWAPVTADLVAVAKFDVVGCVKLRSFYADAGVSARLQVGRGDVRHGISRTLEAYRQVSRHVPELMPRIDDHGPAPFSRGVYLVEEMISGSHPASRDEIQEVAEPLAALLLRLHRGVGVTSRALSGVVHKQMAERWSARRSRVLAAQTRQRLQAIARLLGVHTAAAGETRRYAAV